LGSKKRALSWWTKRKKTTVLYEFGAEKKIKKAVQSGETRPPFRQKWNTKLRQKRIVEGA